MTARSSIAASAALYAGRDYLGEVIQLWNGQFEAALPNGTSVGLFRSKAAAENGLLRWLRGHPDEPHY